MNENAEQGAKKYRDSRFRFGRLQAYTTLAVQVVAALVVLGLLFLALEKGLLTFWTIIGLAVFYAVAQGGRNGFVEIAKGVASFFTNKGKDAPKE